MTRRLPLVLALTLTLTLFAAPVPAQTNVVPVLGVGDLIVEVPASSVIANAQDYAVYVDATRIVVDPSCTQIATNLSECPIPLASLNLTGTHAIAVASILRAVDGEAEGSRVTLPFALLRLATPVGIVPSLNLRPAPPQ